MSLEVARYGSEGFDARMGSVGLQITVNKVCAACNGGWLSQLDDRSMPVLTRIVGGVDEVVILSLREQRQVAVWATKQR